MYLITTVDRCAMPEIPVLRPPSPFPQRGRGKGWGYQPAQRALYPSPGPSEPGSGSDGLSATDAGCGTIPSDD